ncbi:hypothetical protein EPD60_13495 [Flaviaesturariibacter flavus]|uniref:Uncharacterized protein n=1 Tax=Flaviaesturariibacter flavus TaxID=2502780 RepID=A0A4R1B821_9BACT|nr:hypothetical protein [Flaviaesturariibacter flavus]TCJ13397.1 hypothetical protein EPD60_13495 [Flaviaesturariibacter flavus]
MRKLLLLLSVAAAARADAQTYVIEVGQSLNDVLRQNDLFKYSTFRPGIVRFRDGYQKPTLLNYTYYDASLLFIGPKKDTLALSGLEELELATVGTDTFYFHDGVLELLASAPGGRLLQRSSLRQEGSTKAAGYGMYDENAASESLNYLQAANTVHKVPVTNRTVIRRQGEVFIWPDDAAAPLAASRKALEKAFPDRKAAIAAYLRAHSVDFHNPAEVAAIFAEAAGIASN